LTAVIRLQKVRDLLWSVFAGKTVNLERDIYPLIDASPYLHTHANQVKEDVKAGRIINPSPRPQVLPA